MSKSFRFFSAIALFALATTGATAADLPQLKKEEQDKLAELDTELAGQIVEIAAKLDEWKKQIDGLKKTVDGYREQVKTAQKEVENLKGQINAQQSQAMNAVDTLKAAQQLDPKALLKLLETIKPYAEKSESFRKIIDYANAVEAEVKSIEQQVQKDLAAKTKEARDSLAALKADADALKMRGDSYQKQVEDLAALDEAKVQEMVEAQLRFALQEKVMETLGKGVYDKLMALKNPAAFAKGFADGAFNDFLKKNAKITFGDITAKLVKANPKAPLFGPKTEMKVEVEYTGGVKVEVEGFGFKYLDNSPHFVGYFDKDNVKVSSSREAINEFLGKTGLNALGEILPETPGVKITAKLVEFPDFVKNNELVVDVEIGMKEPLAFTLKGLVGLNTAGKATVKDKLKASVDLKGGFIPLPIASAVAVHALEGEYDGKKKEITLGVVLAASSTGAPESVALDLKMTVPFPIQYVEFRGSLWAGGVKRGACLGDLEVRIGKLRKGGQGFHAELDIPGKEGGAANEAVKALLSGHGEITATKEGLKANGIMTLYKVFEADFDLVFNSDGSGRFAGRAKLDKLKVVNVEAEITAEFKSGFKDLTLDTNFNVAIDLSGIKGFGDLLKADVVSVRIKKAPNTPFQIAANGFGFWVEFELGLNEDLMRKLVDKLGEKVEQAVQAISDALAQCDPFNKNSFAGYATRNLDPFNKNSAAARFSKEFDPLNKNSQASKILKKLDLGSLGKQVGIDIPNAPTANDVRREGGKFLNNIFGGLSGRDPDFPSLDSFPALDDESRRSLFLNLLLLQNGQDDNAFAANLEKAAKSVESINLDFRIPTASSKSPRGPISRGSHVNVRLLAPTVVFPTEDRIVIGFVAKATGAAHTIQPGQISLRPSGSRVAHGAIVLTKTGDKWRGKIEQPKIAWEEICLQDPSLELSQKIERLVEIALPGIEIDGLRTFNTAQLLVNNKTKSDLTVSLLRRAKVGDDWTWLPGLPGGKKSYTFKLKVGESKTVTNAMLGGTNDDPMTCNRVRIWAEADEGDDWLTNRDKDFWLVDENPKANNERAYTAEKPREKTFTFAPQSGFRTYSERLVQLKNETAKPIRVDLEYRITEGGTTRWAKIPEFEIKPGETAKPRDAGGQFVRASAIKFLAVSEEYAYRENTDKGLWLVDETDGMRLYQAEKVGVYRHAFQPPAIQGGGGK